MDFRTHARRRGCLRSNRRIACLGSVQHPRPRCSLCAKMSAGTTLDKLIGAELLAGRLPLGERILLVSGRASFERCRNRCKPASRSWPPWLRSSSLAVELADLRHDAVGLRPQSQFNIDRGPQRIAGHATNGNE